MKTREQFHFRLYVAGQSENSQIALTNLRVLCQRHLANRHKIEVVDILSDTKRALGDGILVTPTLVRLSPLPVNKIIGNLSQTDRVLATLGLVPEIQ